MKRNHAKVRNNPPIGGIEQLKIGVIKNNRNIPTREDREMRIGKTGVTTNANKDHFFFSEFPKIFNPRSYRRLNRGNF